MYLLTRWGFARGRERSVSPFIPSNWLCQCAGYKPGSDPRCTQRGSLIKPQNRCSSILVPEIIMPTRLFLSCSRNGPSNAATPSKAKVVFINFSAVSTNLRLTACLVNPARVSALTAAGRCCRGCRQSGRSAVRRHQIAFWQDGKVIHQDVLGLQQRLVRWRRLLGVCLVGIISGGRGCGGRIGAEPGSARACMK